MCVSEFLFCVEMVSIDTADLWLEYITPEPHVQRPCYFESDHKYESNRLEIGASRSLVSKTCKLCGHTQRYIYTMRSTCGGSEILYLSSDQYYGLYIEALAAESVKATQERIRNKLAQHSSSPDILARIEQAIDVITKTV